MSSEISLRRVHEWFVSSRLANSTGRVYDKDRRLKCKILVSILHELLGSKHHGLSLESQEKLSVLLDSVEPDSDPKRVPEIEFNPEEKAITLNYVLLRLNFIANTVSCDPASEASLVNTNKLIRDSINIKTNVVDTSKVVNDIDQLADEALVKLKQLEANTSQVEKILFSQLGGELQKTRLQLEKKLEDNNKKIEELKTKLEPYSQLDQVLFRGLLLSYRENKEKIERLKRRLQS